VIEALQNGSVDIECQVKQAHEVNENLIPFNTSLVGDTIAHNFGRIESLLRP
jgi:hypothetical protein